MPGVWVGVGVIVGVFVGFGVFVGSSVGVALDAGFLAAVGLVGFIVDWTDGLGVWVGSGVEDEEGTEVAVGEIAEVGVAVGGTGVFEGLVVADCPRTGPVRISNAETAVRICTKRLLFIGAPNYIRFIKDFHSLLTI